MLNRIWLRIGKIGARTRRSLIFTERVIDDYAETAGLHRRSLSQLNGNQVGDPKRAVEAMIAAVEASSPPLRLVLGTLHWRQFVPS